MAVNLSPYGGVGAQFFDNAGNVLTGGKIFTYAAGTTTNLATYTTSAGNIFHSNPIILDASGRVPSGGEIWLTDGLSYKFILRDSNDVLIATYDNVVGINSNFVNFTNQQEIQTATAGQTVFNLTTTQYQPGTNSLSVFVDGVNQYGPGAQYAYIETDATTVTFINGLHVGALVKFTTSQLNTSGAVDACQVSYDPPFTSSVPTTVCVKLAETVSVKDFGAVGDGVVDDTAAIQAAIDALASTGGGFVSFPTGTYAVNATAWGAGVNLKNNVYLDLGSSIIEAIPSNSTNYALIFISDAINCGVINGTVIGDRATNTTTAEQGHCIRVVSASSNVLLENIIISDAHGDGIYLGVGCSNITVSKCTISNCYRNNISVVSASDVIIDKCDISNANGTIPQAGIDVEPNPGDPSSKNVSITNCRIYDNAGDGVLSTGPSGTPLVDNGIISNNIIYDNVGSGIRSSTGFLQLNISNNIVKNNSHGFFDSTGTLDSLTIDGNIFYSCGDYGIYGFSNNAIISNNKIESIGLDGINWSLANYVTISGNTINTCLQNGMQVFRSTNVSISSNALQNLRWHGIVVDGSSTSSSQKVSVTGNSIYGASLGTDNIYSGIFFSQYSNKSSITGNTVSAGTTGNLPLYAIYSANTDVYIANNQTDGGAKSGNAQVVVGSLVMPATLSSPNVLSDSYAPRFYLPGLCFITSGTGTPEGAVTALVGSLFLRTNGGASTTLYVKETGSGNTGWVAK